MFIGVNTDMNFYITTTLPYINSEPHIGFALEIVRADAIARWHRSLGDNVFFNTGSDEHGLKIYRKAEELGLSTQEYCNQASEKFSSLKSVLNLSFDNFIRTTDEYHIQAAQAFWQLCQANGDIYKKNYQVKYCVGCELEKTESELVEGKCAEHPNMELEIIDEENYFFRFSKYSEKLLELYKNNSEFVLPEARLKEISAFAGRGFEDFSISRLKTKMPWGVAVPGDENQVMYVWFDALVNYISCLGWPNNKENFEKFWPGVQICGKDNLRQQSAMWQAMLMSAQLPTSAKILVNGFINSNGQKMSKSLGNVVNPLELVNKYGVDAVRYYLLAHINPFEDSDFTIEKFEAAYTADLCNGLGNLVSRASTLIAKNNLQFELKVEGGELAKKVAEKMDKYLYNEAMKEIWNEVTWADEKLSSEQPWKMENTDDIKKCLEPIAQSLLTVGIVLENFLPETGTKIKNIFSSESISKAEALFPRLN